MGKINIDPAASTPIYKQIINDIRSSIADGSLKSGEQIPSINNLADELSISKDTVKKAYAALRKEGLVDSFHGKGFFISHPRDDSKMNILLLFDKLSPLKQVLFQNFNAEIGDKAEITVRFHNQDVDLLDSTYWTCFIHGCTRVSIRGVYIRNHPLTWNGDGIDLDGC